MTSSLKKLEGIFFMFVSIEEMDPSIRLTKLVLDAQK